MFLGHDFSVSIFFLDEFVTVDYFYTNFVVRVDGPLLKRGYPRRGGDKDVKFEAVPEKISGTTAQRYAKKCSFSVYNCWMTDTLPGHPS